MASVLAVDILQVEEEVNPATGQCDEQKAEEEETGRIQTFEQGNTKTQGERGDEACITDVSSGVA